MSNVLLISPPEQHVLMEAGDRPAMSLLYLAASLRENGHNPVISDLNHDSYKTLNTKAKDSDFIGITTMTPYFPWFDQFSKHLKQNYPDKPLIAGGPHATVDPDSLPMFDYVIQGEGEQAIVDIVEGKVKDRIVRYPYRKNLDTFPIPHTELNLGGFSDAPIYEMIQDGKKTSTMLTSRCCNYVCFFCTKGILGKRQRFHSLNRVFKEMEYIQDKGINSFYFLDDTFTEDRDRALAFAKGIKDRKWDISFRYGTRTDKVDSELLDKLIDAGQRSISHGLEHMDDNVLKRMNKGETVKTHLKAIRLAKSKGLKIRGSFIINGPGTNLGTVKRTLETAVYEDLDYADFYPLIAYPGTPIWNKPERFGAEITDKSYGFYQTQDKTNVSFEMMKPQDTSKLVKYCRTEWAKHKGLLCPWESIRKDE